MDDERRPEDVQKLMKTDPVFDGEGKTMARVVSRVYPRIIRMLDDFRTYLRGQEWRTTAIDNMTDEEYGWVFWTSCPVGGAMIRFDIAESEVRTREDEPPEGSHVAMMLKCATTARPVFHVCSDNRYSLDPWVPVEDAGAAEQKARMVGNQMSEKKEGLEREMLKHMVFDLDLEDNDV